jgi:LPS-assembly lipoprotein
MHSDFPYDDNHVLAMEAEEALLYQSMRTDMVQQIVRRLSRIKPVSK